MPVAPTSPAAPSAPGRPGPLLLHLDSAADGPDTSVSRQLTELFAARLRARRPDVRYRHRDLAADPVPPLGPGLPRLGRRLERTGLVPAHEVGAHTRDAEEAREWELTRPLVDELLAADLVLLGVPMYHFSVPAALKAWIDRVGFPGVFTDPAGGPGLLHRTRAVVVATRGGGYGPGTPREPFDFQLPYLRALLENLGVPARHLYTVTAELTLAALVPHLAHLRGTAAHSLATARARLETLADRLAPGAPAPTPHPERTS
ncbi:MULTISPECIES: FMN-dependent NADH-azoreductase [Streptomyces]|uniref:FMN-dependent NADH-azoreductase n=1 Tax=Streptomyces TaxID=1883 RepID=UPI00068971C5|nr:MULTISPECIES: NAD(P)H-dependent oxidoreductase [Streptomyces]